MRRRDEKGPGGVRRLQHGSGRRLQLSMLCGERVRLWRIPRVLAVRWARRQVPRPRLAGRIMWVGEQVGWIIQGVRRRESVFGGWLLSKLPGVTCVCHVRLSFSLSLSLSHSLTPSLFLRLNAAGSARGGEECDDGNTMALDGCDSTCQIEPGYACMHYEPPYYPCGAYSSWCTPVSVSVSVSVAPWRCRYLLYWDSLRSLCPDCCAEGRLPLSSARALTRDIYHAALAGVSTAV